MKAVQRGTYTDRSGITDAGSKEVMAADTTGARAGWFFQNQSDTDMLINFTSDAIAGNSIKVGPGESISSANFSTTELITVYCASSGKVYCAKEFYQS